MLINHVPPTRAPMKTASPTLEEEIAEEETAS